MPLEVRKGTVFPTEFVIIHEGYIAVGDMQFW